MIPPANVQMLPLFAMQLAFMGFAESIPGGLWFQYTAGLNNSDYNGRFSMLMLSAYCPVGCLSRLPLTSSTPIRHTEGVMEVEHTVQWEPGRT